MSSANGFTRPVGWLPALKPRNVLGRDADAGVLDVEGRALGGVVRVQAHGACIGRIADRIAHQVAERAGELLLVAHEVESGLRVDLDAMASARKRPGFGAQP